MGFGGGLAISQQTYIKESLKFVKSQSMFILSDCNITNNTASTGAGMAVKLTDKYILTHCQKKYCFQFQSCIFNNNTAQRGAAIHSMLVTTLDSPQTLHDICIMAFLNRSCIPLCFEEYNQFEYNNASGLSVGATVVSLNGVMKFSNNTGMNGGGIVVYDGGSIVIQKGLQGFLLIIKPSTKDLLYISLMLYQDSMVVVFFATWICLSIQMIGNIEWNLLITNFYWTSFHYKQ